MSEAVGHSDHSPDVAPIRAPRAPRRRQTEVDQARQEKNKWKKRALVAERALALIRTNCVALANDDEPDVDAASALAYQIARRLRMWPR